MKKSIYPGLKNVTALLLSLSLFAVLLVHSPKVKVDLNHSGMFFLEAGETGDFSKIYADTDKDGYTNLTGHPGWMCDVYRKNPVQH
jgi:hypothetical protein